MDAKELRVDINGHKYSFFVFKKEIPKDKGKPLRKHAESGKIIATWDKCPLVEWEAVLPWLSRAIKHNPKAVEYSFEISIPKE